VAVAFGYNNPGNDKDNWMTVGGSYNAGVVKVGGLIGRGKNTADQKVSSWMLNVTVPLGQGELRGSLVSMNNSSALGSTDPYTNKKTIQGFGVGYFYSLSKRTTLYADVANNSKQQIGQGTGAYSSTAAYGEKTAYDFGIKHAF